MKKRLLHLFVCLAAMVLLVGAVTANASGLMTTSNAATQTYRGNWASPIKSHLNATATGYERCEYVEGRGLLIEQYDKEYNYVSGFIVDMELPVYGGVYYHHNFNFLITGQYNYEESDSVEVFRVTKYDKNWNRLGACSIKAADTSSPFRAGTVRCIDSQGKLYVRTCHEMYTSSDGLNHQSSCTFAIDMYNMRLVCTDAAIRLTGSYNNSYGYVSHSFNQFIQVDGNTLLIVDHGDAYPRAVSLMKYKNSTKEANFYSGKTTGINVLNIPGSIGANYTGVQVGGFEYSSTNYIIAGNAVTASNQKNIYVTSTSKSNFSAAGSQIIWITDHSSGVNVSNVQLVKISDTNFFLAWTENDVLTYTFLNQYGQSTGKVYTANGMLSDCKPIVTNNKIVWYATEVSYPYFYVIDLNNPGTVEYIHDCDYTWSITTPPTATSTGSVTVRCLLCDETEILTMPKLNTTDYRLEVDSEPTCYKNGLNVYYWDHAVYGEIPTYEQIAALEHKYGDWTVTYQGYCGGYGWHEKSCEYCGRTISEKFAVDHDYGEWFYEGYGCTDDGSRYRFCNICYERQEEYLSAVGHQFDGIYCTECGSLKFYDIVGGSYYIDPVNWAVKNDITNGTGDGTTFSPRENCTRSQVVTLIWRSCGSPAPSGKNPFEDVPDGQWYTDAVIWAVEQGITTGVGDGSKFAPNDPCTRSQVVTFLHRLNNQELVSTSNPFTDVKSSDWYYNAVMWAVKNKITTGTSATTFEPGRTVDRAQFVTFLYRAS